jgi:hypothetical protein
MGIPPVLNACFDRLSMRSTLGLLALSLSKGAAGKETAKRRKMG